MKRVEIYFSDLNFQAQKEVMEAYDMKDPSEGNFEVVPLAILDIMEGDTDD